MHIYPLSPYFFFISSIPPPVFWQGEKISSCHNDCIKYLIFSHILTKVRRIFPISDMNSFRGFTWSSSCGVLGCCVGLHDSDYLLSNVELEKLYAAYISVYTCERHLDIIISSRMSCILLMKLKALTPHQKYQSLV
jgi:hypothetical protein